jgi:hypothetical protein
VIRSVGLLTENQQVTTRLADGSFKSQVIATTLNKLNKKKKG